MHSRGFYLPDIVKKSKIETLALHYYRHLSQMCFVLAVLFITFLIIILTVGIQKIPVISFSFMFLNVIFFGIIGMIFLQKTDQYMKFIHKATDHYEENEDIPTSSVISNKWEVILMCYGYLSIFLALFGASRGF